MTQAKNAGMRPDRAFDIEDEDILADVSEQQLKQPKSAAGEREDPTPVESTRAVVREGRDSVLGASDIDENEDNRAPGAREQK